MTTPQPSKEEIQDILEKNKKSTDEWIKIRMISQYESPLNKQCDDKIRELETIRRVLENAIKERG